MPVADSNTGTQYFDKNGNPATGGEVYFYTTGTTTLKNIYSDIDGSTTTANPVQLLDGGIMPLVFLDGAYRRIVKDKNGVQLFDLDPIGGDPSAFGALGDWNAAVTYSIHDLTTGSNGKYYKSLQNSNLNKDPTLSNPTWWSEVDFISIYNSSETYAAGDVSADANGLMWASQTSQSGNTPSTDNGTNWKPVVNIDALNTFKSDTQSVIDQTGGGALTALRINEIRDGGTYTLPLANSVSAEQWIIIDLPERYKSSEPIINRSGSDTITDSSGTDTSITYGSTSWGRIYLTSDGASNWSL